MEHRVCLNVSIERRRNAMAEFNAADFDPGSLYGGHGSAAVSVMPHGIDSGTWRSSGGGATRPSSAANPEGLPDEDWQISRPAKG